MPAGKRKHQIVVQQSTTTNDVETNEPILAWVAWRTVQAQVEIKRGREFFENGQRYAETFGRFTCYYHDVDGITETMQIYFDSRLWDIKGIVEDFDHRRNMVIDASLIV